MDSNQESLPPPVSSSHSNLLTGTSTHCPWRKIAEKWAMDPHLMLTDCSGGMSVPEPEACGPHGAPGGPVSPPQWGCPPGWRRPRPPSCFPWQEHPPALGATRGRHDTVSPLQRCQLPDKARSFTTFSMKVQVKTKSPRLWITHTSRLKRLASSHGAYNYLNNCFCLAAVLLLRD